MRRLLLILYSSLFTLHSSLLHAQLYEQSVRAIVEALAVDSLDKAKGMIEQTIRLDPMRKSNAVLYQYLGGIYQQRGDNEKALEAYAKGIDLSPTSLDLYLNRASLYLGLNNDKRALSDYNKGKAAFFQISRRYIIHQSPCQDHTVNLSVFNNSLQT